MHFDPVTLAMARDQMPKGLLALVERAQGASKTIADEGLPRRSFLKMGVASGFALGAYPLVATAQDGKAATPAGVVGSLSSNQRGAVR